MTDLESKRFGVRFPNGETLYYEIDPDGKVYWLRQQGAQGKMVRWKVKYQPFVEWIKEQYSKLKEQATDAG